MGTALRAAADDFGVCRRRVRRGEVCGPGLAPHLTAQRSPQLRRRPRRFRGAVWPTAARGARVAQSRACSTRGASADGSADPGLEFNPITVGDDRGVSLRERLAGALRPMGVDGRAAGTASISSPRLPAAARAVSFDGGAAFGLTLKLAAGTPDSASGSADHPRIGGLRIRLAAGPPRRLRRAPPWARACDRTGRRCRAGGDSAARRAQSGQQWAGSLRPVRACSRSVRGGSRLDGIVMRHHPVEPGARTLRHGARGVGKFLERDGPTKRKRQRDATAAYRRRNGAFAGQLGTASRDDERNDGLARAALRSACRSSVPMAPGRAVDGHADGGAIRVIGVGADRSGNARLTSRASVQPAANERARSLSRSRSLVTSISAACGSHCVASRSW